MIQWMSMPKVALMAMEDPINEQIRKFVSMVKIRTNDP